MSLARRVVALFSNKPGNLEEYKVSFALDRSVDFRAKSSAPTQKPTKKTLMQRAIESRNIWLTALGLAHKIEKDKDQ